MIAIASKFSSTGRAGRAVQGRIAAQRSLVPALCSCAQIFFLFLPFAAFAVSLSRLESSSMPHFPFFAFRPDLRFHQRFSVDPLTLNASFDPRVPFRAPAVELELDLVSNRTLFELYYTTGKYSSGHASFHSTRKFSILYLFQTRVCTCR